MTSIAQAATILYGMATGEDLDAPDTASLHDLVAVGPDGRWASAYPAPLARDTPLLVARALTGLFLLDERMLWSAKTAIAADHAFRNLRALIDGAAALRARVQRWTAANGAQCIQIRDGGTLWFVGRGGGGRTLRGLSVDCHLAQNADGQGRQLALNVVSRPNPQLIQTW